MLAGTGRRRRRRLQPPRWCSRRRRRSTAAPTRSSATSSPSARSACHGNPRPTATYRSVRCCEAPSRSHSSYALVPHGRVQRVWLALAGRGPLLLAVRDANGRRPSSRRASRTADSDSSVRRRATRFEPRRLGDRLTLLGQAALSCTGRASDHDAGPRGIVQRLPDECDLAPRPTRGHCAMSESNVIALQPLVPHPPRRRPGG